MRRIVVAVAAAAAALAPAAPAGAAESGSVGIRPEAQQDWFRFSARPGGALRDAVVVSNKTARTVRLRLYAVDATVTPQGSFALRERGEPRTGFGAWVRLPFARLTLAAGRSLRVPFRIAIPARAEPGDFAGGIVVERALGRGEASDVRDDLAVRFNLVERVGVRAFLRVRGAVVRAVSAGPLAWERVGGGIAFSLLVRNTGTVRVTPSGTLALSGWRTPGARIALSAPEVLLPGSTGVLRAVWRNPPALARPAARATVAFGGPRPVERATALWLFPWRIALVALAVAAALAFAVVRLGALLGRARRALRLVERPVEPAPGPPSAPAVTALAPLDAVRPIVFPALPRAPEPPPHDDDRDVALWLAMFGERPA